APHLAAALLLSASSVEMTHIPYKGNGEALSELLGERLDAVFSGLPSVVPLAKAGKLRPLAVTGTKRSAMLPDVPSVVEAGFPAAQAQVWYGLMAPAQTPGEIVVRLHTAIEKAVNQPGMKEKFIELGLEPAIDSPEEFRTLIKEDSQRLGKVIRSVGMKAE
ncbi:MAG TPA: tripartite tricarboxylate transporter substrate-binding protein, partial [Burkholderiaceae bacterium]|nr:tripartite tricarboxylate transporter substrate-binding protein [Burkholderiaceae bacterium]